MCQHTSAEEVKFVAIDYSIPFGTTLNSAAALFQTTTQVHNDRLLLMEAFVKDGQRPNLD